MNSLYSVQASVQRAIDRDWNDKSLEDKLNMVMCGIGEEAGEVLGLHKRFIRANPKDLERDLENELVEEVGDVLWYLAALCSIKGINLDTVWDINQRKLEARYGNS